MKLLLLLSDEAPLAHRVDTELKIVREETKEASSLACGVGKTDERRSFTSMAKVEH